MSVSGISSSSLFDFNTQAAQNKRQQFLQEFQQLGQDLQSGNLSAAQSDFAALEQLKPQTSSTASSSSSSPIAQAFKQLSQDLQSGNVSARGARAPSSSRWRRERTERNYSVA